MEFDPKDSELIQLLKKLKNSNGAYPQEMLAVRRQGYLKQVAEISAGAGLAVGLKNVARGGKAAGLPPATGTVVEILLIMALIAEAGIVSFFYGDKLVEMYRSYTNPPIAEHISNPPVSASPIASPTVEIQVTPSPTITTVTATETPTAVGTPSLEYAAEPTQRNRTEGTVNTTTNSTTDTGSTNGNNNGSGVASTPDPKGNNGNHYGQTPKPERTKEPGNDISNQNQENNSNPDSNKNTDSKKNK